MTNRIETILKLRMAQVSSCSCLTKTPDAAWHKEDCLYRVLTEEISAVAVSNDLLEALQKIQFRSECYIEDDREMSVASVEMIKLICDEAINKATTIQ